MILLFYAKPIVNLGLKFCVQKSFLSFAGLKLENNAIKRNITCSGFLSKIFQKQHFSIVATDIEENNEQQNDDSPVKYIVSKEDFKWVQRVLPPSVIPDPPKHDTYPTPSGWSPPSEIVPDLPYYISRTRYHCIPVFAKKKKNVNFTLIENIEGDIWAFEKELIELIKPLMIYDPATQVHEVKRSVVIKGNFADLIKNFLLEKGF